MSQHSEPPITREAAREYILDMLGELARMARKYQEPRIAIMLAAVRTALGEMPDSDASGSEIATG